MEARRRLVTRWQDEARDRERRLGPMFAKPGIVRYARQATGVLLAGVEALMSSRISVQGTHNIPDGPVLFAANHFTRSETFILPYLIDRYTRRTALSLAHYGLFQGLFGDYLRCIGALSTRHPDIKNRMVEDLLTGRHDWLIYPEGAMIKNKKVWSQGHFMLETPDRTGSPHTGSAVIALQVLIYRELIRRSEEEGKHEMAERLKQRFHVVGPLPETFHIIPINISYYPIRPGPNAVYRLARLLMPQLPKTLAEELTIEGNLLFKDADITVYFGKPVDLNHYRTLMEPGMKAALAGDERAVNDLLEGLKYRVTNRLMGEVYRRLTVNIDHLVCSAIRYRRRQRLPIDDLRAIVYLAARDLQRSGDRRVHRSIDGSLLRLLIDEPSPGLESIIKLARDTAAAAVVDGVLHIDPEALNRRHAFHDIRIKNPIGVIANEIEPLREAVGAVRSVTNLPSAHLRERISDLLYAEDLVEFEHDYQAGSTAFAAGEQPEPKPREVCAPFLLHKRGAECGIVLAHGYLAAPREVRDLADWLHAEGFSVYGVRLKGHGTVPGQLAAVDWRDWQVSYDRAYAVMKHLCRRVIVAGFSSGALLALRVAARRAGAIIGAVAVNPAVSLVDAKSALVPGVVGWNRILSRFGIGGARFEWIPNHPEFPDVNYTRNYLNGVWQLRRLISITKRDLPRIATPTLVVQADHDPVVSVRGTRRLYARLGSEDKELALVTASRHGILRGEGSREVHERITEFCRRLAHQHHALHLTRVPSDPAIPIDFSL